MKNLIFLFALVVLFAACNDNNQDKKVAHVFTAENDTLTYRYDSIRVVSNNLVKSNLGTPIDTSNAVVKYPIFENEELNNHIKKRVFDFFADEEHPTAYEDIASSFVRGYNDFYLHNPGTVQWWFLRIDISVIRQLHNYIALKHVHSDYAGGAHGNAMISYINYNPKTNEPIALDSLIIPQKKAELLKLAESIFRKNEKISDEVALDKDYFFTNGRFSLPDNFYVSKNGLVFLYNTYEIKPYAQGTTELIVPLDQLKTIAKPNTILTPNADI
jgi:hypothetical protein